MENPDPNEIEYAEFLEYDDNQNQSEVDEDVFEIEDYNIPDFTKTDIAKFNNYNPTLILTEAEKRVLNSCTDPSLKELLILNRTKNTKLMQSYKKVKDLLVACQEGITEMEEKLKKMNNMAKRRCPKFWRLGSPYFKSAEDFPCPRNEDAIKKQNRGELLFYRLSPSVKWKRKDINRLLKAVAFYYKTSKITKLENQIRTLEINQNKTKAEKEELNELKNKLKDLKDDDQDYYPELGCENCLDWPRIAMNFLKDRFSAEDCKIFWNTYLHPSINKNPWTPEENTKLKSLVLANNYQNWDLIARELGGNRTAFISCAHFYCKIELPRTRGHFSAEEDKLVLDLVNTYKEGDIIPWAKIIRAFPGRTRMQIYYRYTYFLKCRDKKKGRFTEAEDILILILVGRFGKKFAAFSQYLPHRSSVQIKSRYTCQLTQATKKGSFTEYEDQKILDLVKQNGSHRWAYMEKIFQRSSGQIRQRYLTLKAFQTANPDKGLDEAPRKNYDGVYPDFDAKFNFLRLMVDKFKKYENIPTVEEIEALLQKQSSSTSENMQKSEFRQQKKDKENFFPSLAVDELLIEYFSTAKQMKLENNLKNTNIQSAAITIQNILTSLKAELFIPKDYKNDGRLDQIDVKILDAMTKKLPVSDDKFVMKRKNCKIEKLVPPNLNTVIGLRYLLIQNEVYRNSNDFQNDQKEYQLLWLINKHISCQENKVQKEMILERNMFFQRFTSLFKFPAIISLVTPSSFFNKNDKPVVKTYARKLKTIPSIPTKPNEKLFVKSSNQDDYESDPNDSIVDDPSQKSNIADELKRRIQENIKDLMTQPPGKKFYHHVTTLVKKSKEPAPSVPTYNSNIRNLLETNNHPEMLQISSKESFGKKYYYKRAPTKRQKLDTDSSSTPCSQVSQDLQDLQLLDDFLKNEKQNLKEEENFEF